MLATPPSVSSCRSTERPRSSRRGPRSRSWLAATVALATGLLASFSSSGCVQVEGDIPEVVVTQQHLSFDGAPAIPAGLGADAALTREFEHPYDSFDVPAGFETELRPVRATLTATDGVSDLAFLRGFALVVGSRSPDAPMPQKVFEYTRDDDAPPGRELTVEALVRPNVIELWNTGEAYYSLTVYGAIPQTDWALDVAVEFHGRVSVHL